MCYNILPGGNTLLHKLSINSDIIEELFRTVHPNEDDKTYKLFHIPFLPNL